MVAKTTVEAPRVGYIVPAADADWVAQEMLAHNPKIAAEFKKRLAQDPGFAGSPQQRLEFFYKKSPAWDERLDLYPVYRVERALPWGGQKGTKGRIRKVTTGDPLSMGRPGG